MRLKEISKDRCLWTARAYGCLSPSFSRLESDTRRRGAFSLYWDLNAFALGFDGGAVDFHMKM